MVVEPNNRPRSREDVDRQVDPAIPSRCRVYVDVTRKAVGSQHQRSRRLATSKLQGVFSRQLKIGASPVQFNVFVDLPQRERKGRLFRNSVKLVRMMSIGADGYRNRACLNLQLTGADTPPLHTFPSGHSDGRARRLSAERQHLDRDQHSDLFERSPRPEVKLGGLGCVAFGLKYELTDPKVVERQLRGRRPDLGTV